MTWRQLYRNRDLNPPNPPEMFHMPNEVAHSPNKIWRKGLTKKSIVELNKKGSWKKTNCKQHVFLIVDLCWKTLMGALLFRWPPSFAVGWGRTVRWGKVSNISNRFWECKTLKQRWIWHVENLFPDFFSWEFAWKAFLQRIFFLTLLPDF